MEITQAEIQTLIEEYADKAADLEKNRRFGEGLFGITRGPADDHCHDQFVEDLRAMLTQFAGQNPSSGQVLSVLETVYSAAAPYESVKSAYWMLLAVHGQTLDLIPLLNPEDASGLLSRYKKQFPRRFRMPVQRQVITALSRQQ